MTALEQYQKMPKDIQNLISDYMAWAESVDDCFETIISLAPKKECSLTALLEAYGSYVHERLKIKEQLEERGINSAEAYRLGAAHMIARE